MISNIINDTSLPEKAIDNNHKSHAWHKLDSFFSLREKDVEGLKDVDVIFTTNKSMELLIDLLSPINENYIVP